MTTRDNTAHRRQQTLKCECLKRAGTLALLFFLLLSALAIAHAPVAAADQSKSSTANSGKSMPIFKVSPEPPWGPTALMTIDYSGLNTLLQGQMKDGQFNPADLEKLDFSLPGDPGFGKHPNFEVYNPAGPFKMKPRQQRSYDAVTNTKNVRPIYNLRRTIDATGMIIDTLYKIIPDVSRRACADAADHLFDDTSTGIHRPLPVVDVSDRNIRLPADNHHIVVDSSPIPDEVKAVCVRLADGKLYTFRYIAHRFRKPGENKWRTQ